VILPDSSVWIELIRGTRSVWHEALRTLIDRDADLVTSEVVLMEVLAGAASRHALRQMRSALLAYPVLRLRGVDDYEEAVEIFRTCRASGAMIRSLSDCLIAVPAIRAGASVLHNDRDFDVIARHSGLRIEPVEGPSPSLSP
jgi:predicted nucleic acid-binding protein